MRHWPIWALGLCWACTSDVADQEVFACEVHNDCRIGWFCKAQVCAVGVAPEAGPPDSAVDSAPADARPKDAQPSDAQPSDAQPSDAQPSDAQPSDAAPDMMRPPMDRDGDGWLDADDNCPDVHNPQQLDRDEDGVGDACARCGGDADCLLDFGALRCEPDRLCGGTIVSLKAFGRCIQGRCDDFDPPEEFFSPCAAGDVCEPLEGGARCRPDPLCEDRDGDGVPDAADNCPDVHNPDQRDQDQDGIGDVCRACRIDADCQLEVALPQCEVNDACEGTLIRLVAPGRCVERQCGQFAEPVAVREPCPATDRCVPLGDGASCRPDDACRGGDADGDGVPDQLDNCPDLPNPNQIDRNADGVGDVCTPCALDSDCRIPFAESRCQVDNECGGAVIQGLVRGRCLRAGRCGDFGPPEETFDRCGAGDRCVVARGGARCEPTPECRDGEDADGDGVLDGVDNCVLSPNPGQEDRDRDGTGDLCEACFMDSECFSDVAARCEMEDFCGSPIIASRRHGSCMAGVCGAFDRPRDTALPCPAGTLCGIEGGGAVCREDPICGAQGCDLRNDGQACAVDDGAIARCVSGICQPWACQQPACNENGPRHPIAPVIAEGDFVPMREGEVFDGPAGLNWYIVDAEVLSLGDAHAYCEGALAAVRGDGWRLPTWHELTRVARRTEADALRYAELGWDAPADAIYLSRTVVDGGRTMGIELASGESGAVARELPDGDARRYRAICVQDQDPPADLELRRMQFDFGEPVQDPWTGFTWTRPAPVGRPRADAAEACAIQGLELPYVEDLLSLLTMNVPQPPGPGFWLEWDGIDFTAVELSLWAADDADADADGVARGYVVDMGTGAVRYAGVGFSAPHLCVQRPF